MNSVFCLMNIATVEFFADPIETSLLDIFFVFFDRFTVWKKEIRNFQNGKNIDIDDDDNAELIRLHFFATNNGRNANG